MKRICRPDGAGFVFENWFYKDVAPTALGIALENSPAIYGWAKRPINFSSPVPVAPKRSEGGRDGRSLSSLTGLGIFERAKPRAKALGYFQKSQRDFIIQPSVGQRRLNSAPKKRWRATALQDADARPDEVR